VNSFHAAKIESSPRLQRVLDFLRERGTAGATTWEINSVCRTTRAPSDLSELAHNGIAHTCELEEVKQDGTRVFRYRLIPKQTELLT
jgi:hypothetical protein